VYVLRLKTSLLQFVHELQRRRYALPRDHVVLTHNSLPRLTKDPNFEEWLPQLHVSKDSLGRILTTIKDHRVLHTNSTTPQIVPWDQLIIFLRHLVSQGSTMSPLCSDLGIGYGAI
jgi:hypothetical protein